LLLGLIALLGYMAIAAGIKPLAGATAGTVDSNTVVPLLFQQMFPGWFAGVAFAAVGIGALVPAAIMSIAAANLFTRNIYREYLRRDATPAQEAQVSKVTSLVVKVGALAFIIFLDPQFSIDLQLIGGVIILQTLPAVAIGLYTRWLHRWGLVAGWVAGMGLGTWMLYKIPNAAGTKKHFGGSAFPLSNWIDPTTIGINAKATIYVGFVAVVVNLAVAALVTLVCRAAKAPDGIDLTSPDDYFADEGDPRIGPPTVDDLVSPRKDPDPLPVR
jgi:SSS family solute:Na+ symporter